MLTAEDCDKVLESIFDIQKYTRPIFDGFPSASEISDILERENWKEELKRRNIYNRYKPQDILVNEEKENVDNELMPPPPMMPIKKEKIKKERKTRQRSASRSETSDNIGEVSVRRSTRLKSKSVIPLKETMQTIVPDGSIVEGSDSMTAANTVQNLDEVQENVAVTQNLNMSLNRSPQQSSSYSSYEEAQEEVQADANNVDSNIFNAASSTFIVTSTSPCASGTFIVEKSPSPRKIIATSSKSTTSNFMDKMTNYMSPVKSRIANYEKLTSSNSKIPLTASWKKTQPTVSRTIQEPKKQLLNTKSTTPTNHVGKVVSVTTSAQKRMDAEEAQKKKKAMLQARAEESRQKREERQLKAQKCRENRNFLKQQALFDAEKLKREKLNNRLLEQRLVREQKSKISELKRQAIFNKIISTKGTRNHIQKMDKDKPVYMTESKPPLPSPYYIENIDDEDEENHNQHDKLQITERLDELPYIPRQVVNTIFFLEPATPNLAMLFPSIKQNKLRRNSSAVWDKLPDFSKFDIGADLSEEDEDCV